MQKVQPYEGNEPYIFFSYAHKNDEAALSIIHRLSLAGYRVWYDEGIDPGTEFAEIIAAHVKGCSYFMALMSEEYLASEYCKDELDYARNLNKPRVLVYLQQVTLPDGMQMRLSRIQAIHKYAYQDEDAFYKKLFQAQGIGACLTPGNPGDGSPRAKKAPAPAPVKVAAAKATPKAPVTEGHFPLLLLREPAPELPANEQENARTEKLTTLFQAANLPVRIHKITHGPAVSRYELAFDGTVRIKDIQAMEQNIALELDAWNIRLEVPIPGTSLIGLEVPRKQRRTITLREVLQSEEMQYAKGALPMALGVDIAGKPVICDLARMPHVLLGGVTGSGKSVCIHSMLLSLLYRNGPEDLQLILYDPTGAEMPMYRGLPHLRSDITGDPYQTCTLLQETLEEMMRRYSLFQEAGVRNVDSYNEKLQPGRDKLPRIVFVIDELSDLMMVCKKEAEEAICRLAQLGRAAGIHLVIASLRCSPQVITGLIRASIPSRIGFCCVNAQDSRHLLDRSGAEKLMGRGDMLYAPAGSFSPMRVQGCYVSEEEAGRAADYLSEKAAQ